MADDTHGARHGAETYFVEGEGILGGSIDDESARPLATAAAAGTPAFHFSRMGPKGTSKQLGRPLRVKLAEKMAAGGGGESKIPAGFTYLGQFLDHDLTFDRTTVTLGTNITPARCCRAARRRWTSTRCTAPARAIRSRRSSTRPTASI